MGIQISLTTGIFLCLGISCGAVSTFFLCQEIGEVNRKMPEDKQISYFGMYPSKFSRIKKEYQRLYPDGWIHRIGSAFEIAAVVFLLLAAVSAGFFRNLAPK